MVRCTKAKMGPSVSRVAYETAHITSPNPKSSNTSSKGKTHTAATYCHYLGNLVAKLDRLARIPKLMIQSAKSKSDAMHNPGPREFVQITLVLPLLWMSLFFASVIYFGLLWKSFLCFVAVIFSIFLKRLLFSVHHCSKQGITWSQKSNRLNKDGNYAVPDYDIDLGISFMPSITTTTIIDGWTQDHTEKLRAAVKRVVAANPILSGKIVVGEGGKGLAIAPAERTDLDPATLNIVAGPKEFDLPADIIARCRYCQEVLDPLVPDVGNAMQQKASGGPLFVVSVIELPGSRAAYSVSLSHIVGDAWTYYALIDQLDCFVNSQSLNELLTWDKPEISLEVDHWSDRDKFRTTKLMIPAFICKMLRKKLVGLQRYSQFLEIVDSNAMNKLKEASRGASAFVSTNDMVTSAIYKLYQNEMAIMACNLRGSKGFSLLPPRTGGNFVRLVFHPCALAANSPAFIREKLSCPPYVYFGTNEVPFLPMARNDFGSITNWCSLTKFIAVSGSTVLCHVPHRKFVETSLTNHTIVFKADPTTIVCNHNIPPSDVKAGLRSAELSKKVFKLPVEGSYP